MKKFRKIALIVLLGAFSLPAFAQPVIWGDGDFISDFIHKQYVQYSINKVASSELALEFGIDAEDLSKTIDRVNAIIKEEQNFTNAIMLGTQEQALESFEKLTEMYGGTAPEFKDLIIKAIKLFYQAETEEDYKMIETTLSQEIKGIRNQEWQWRRDIFAAMLASSVIKLKG